MMLLTIAAIGQKTVNGTITDEFGETLIGVNILEKGTTNGTSTDIDGTFSLAVAGEASILEISYTGMANQDVPVAGLSTINVTMISDAEVLDELVVIGYNSS